jgi:hypothetical protein
MIQLCGNPPGPAGQPTEWPDDYEGVPCCMGSAVNGPAGCTCWRPIYDRRQRKPVAGPPPVRSEMCADCAYRPGSPERADTFLYEQIDSITYNDRTPFYCHQGIRRVVAWRHPDGRVLDAEPGAYAPGREHPPCKANGQPAEVCGGWAAIAAARAE